MNTPITSALHTIVLLASFATKNHLGPSAFVPVAVSLAWHGEMKAENKKVHGIECGGPHTFHHLCPTQTISKTFTFHFSIWTNC